MKRLFFSLFVYSFSIIAFSQQTTTIISRPSQGQGQGPVMMYGPGASQVKFKKIDTGVLRVLYEAKAVKDAAKPENANPDYMALDIGEKGVSRFYSDNRRRMDSVMTEIMKGASGGAPIQIDKNTLNEKGVTSSGDTKEIFKNYPSGKISVTDRIATSDYLYEENKPDFQWQIEPETREILSYTCQKAVTNFRGRRYEVWFAPELPINDGPWKFSGLPGLILAAEDSEKNFTFQAVGIENSTNPVDFPDKSYLKTSRTEVAKIQKKYSEDPTGFMANSMPAGVNIQMRSIDGGVERTGSEVKLPYNPMELE